MDERFRETILAATQAKELHEREQIQSLWSGYGRIARFDLDGGNCDTVVAKLVRIPTAADHPRGWNTDFSHQRKLRSYEVERAWYRDFNDKCTDACRTPRCIAQQELGSETLIALEDLDAAGFSARRTRVTRAEAKACLRWLANFHAVFIGCEPEGLWRKGTYWHLDTRPDEWEALTDQSLKNAASAIDAKLDACSIKTLVHGDAKLANFCFDAREGRVAAVDFQYVGGGCGMKDVAYFVGSCMDEEACERNEVWALDTYFAYLGEALRSCGRKEPASEVEAEWRPLYRVAWADFHRFLKGWSPGHWKLTDYSERVTREVVAKLV